MNINTGYNYDLLLLHTKRPEKQTEEDDPKQNKKGRRWPRCAPLTTPPTHPPHRPPAHHTVLRADGRRASRCRILIKLKLKQKSFPSPSPSPLHFTTSYTHPSPPFLPSELALTTSSSFLFLNSVRPLSLQPYPLPPDCTPCSVTSINLLSCPYPPTIYYSLILNSAPDTTTPDPKAFSKPLHLSLLFQYTLLHPPTLHSLQFSPFPPTLCFSHLIILTLPWITLVPLS